MRDDLHVQLLFNVFVCVGDRGSSSLVNSHMDCELVPFSAVVQEPALRLVSILLKYGPWRDALFCAYKKVKREFGGQGVQGRAQNILEILKQTCHAMDGIVPDAWIENLGHNMTHCSGPVPTLTRLGVLRAVKGSGSPGVQKMQFGKQPRCKRFCRGVKERGVALHRIAKYISVADKIGDLAGPRTCQEWIDSHASLVELVQGLGCPGVQEKSISRGKKRRCSG